RHGQVADVDTEGRARTGLYGEDKQRQDVDRWEEVVLELCFWVGAVSVDANSESEKCYICLSPFEKQTVGSLDKCPHFFCFECIHQWSQTANTCPVDRISFSYILQRKCPEGDIQKKVAKPLKDDETEEDWRSVVICEECGRSGRRDRLLVCRHCDSGYHMDCLTPPLNSAPEGDWACPDCATTLQNSGIYLISKMC
uniref:PHD and ring finger domains 1 n=1 Tax=Cyprinodon variegatus TaxID=28743 RepID=A0A3Q2CP46_CYPVA